MVNLLINTLKILTLMMSLFASLCVTEFKLTLFSGVIY